MMLICTTVKCAVDLVLMHNSFINFMNVMKQNVSIIGNIRTYAPESLPESSQAIDLSSVWPFFTRMLFAPFSDTT